MALIPIASTHESLSVAGTATATANGVATGSAANATYAILQVLIANIRWTKDGTTPTASVGNQALNGSFIHLRSNADIKAFKAIREGGTSATVEIDYFSGDPTPAESTLPAVGSLTLSYTAAVVSGAVTSSSASAGVGYATGAGAAVTQATSRTTGVTINAICGAITTDTSSLAAAAEAEFTVTNSAVAATDVVVVCLKTESATGTSLPFVSTVGAGSFKITLTNLHATTADTSASVINFAIIKSVAA